MTKHDIVSEEQWIEARLALLAGEKYEDDGRARSTKPAMADAS